jgi:Lrp/AsnC family leucine-responsive transcriptional regulator
MPSKPKSAESSKVPVKLDETDRRILQLLQQDARMTVKDLASAVNLSATPVHERIKRLETSGVIRGYSAVVDRSKTGKSLMVICYVSLREHSRAAGTKFIKSIMSMEEVTECYNISGEFDFMLKVVAAGMDEYYDFHVNKLSQIENIGNLQSTFIMGVIKETFART